MGFRSRVWRILETSRIDCALVWLGKSQPANGELGAVTGGYTSAFCRTGFYARGPVNALCVVLLKSTLIAQQKAKPNCRTALDPCICADHESGCPIVQFSLFPFAFFVALRRR